MQAQFAYESTFSNDIYDAANSLSLLRAVTTVTMSGASSQLTPSSWSLLIRETNRSDGSSGACIHISITLSTTLLRELICVWKLELFSFVVVLLFLPGAEAEDCTETTNEDNLRLDEVELNSMLIRVEDGDGPAGVTGGSGDALANDNGSMPGNDDGGMPGNDDSGTRGNDDGSMPGNDDGGTPGNTGGDGGTLGNTGSGCDVAGSTGGCCHVGNADNDCDAAGNGGNVAAPDDRDANRDGCKSHLKWPL